MQKSKHPKGLFDSQELNRKLQGIEENPNLRKDMVDSPYLEESHLLS